MNDPLPILEILLRIAAATLAGALVGLEREKHGRPAGLRTTILTCVAAALSMVISEALFVEAGESATWRPDPARLGAGILTGIGFLGAGTIMRHSNIIRGVTTAASLWFVTVLGLAFGSGLYFAGFLGLAVAMISLMLLPGVEKQMESDWYQTLTVTAAADALTEAELRRRVERLGLTPKRLRLKHDFAAQLVTIWVEVQLSRQKAAEMPEKVLAELQTIKGIREVEWA